MTSDQASTLASQITDRTGFPTRTVHLYRGDDGFAVAVDDVIAYPADTPVLVHRRAGQSGFTAVTYRQDDTHWLDTVDSVCAALATWTAGKQAAR